MTADRLARARDLLSDVERHGASVVPLTTGQARLQQAERLPPELVSELVTLRDEIRTLLDPLQGWPRECRDAVRRFRCWHARLFPLIGGPVETPLGPGVLVAAAADPGRCSVRLRSESARVHLFHWTEIQPRDAKRSGRLRRA